MLNDYVRLVAEQVKVDAKQISATNCQAHRCYCPVAHMWSAKVDEEFNYKMRFDFLQWRLHLRLCPLKPFD